jgi:EAL domain-containing protein (putative c-di-GMP-specific phosphodiesterase class I)
VLPNVDTAGAVIVAQRLCEAVRAVTIRQAPGWKLSVSIATATAQPSNGTMKSPELLSRADQALCAAKDAGKDQVVAYEYALAGRADLEAAIRAGLTDGQFELYYQPIIDLHTGRVAGFEALMRWNRPGHGLIPPDAFIPIAETSTLICDLGRWALLTATTQLKSWLEQGLHGGEPLRIAVNASGRHIAGPDIVIDVAAALDSSGLPADCLELELTETALVDGDLVGAHLAEVRALGATVSIDDFGTGYTSVGQLPNLPVDTLKIDRSFIASTDPRQHELVVLMIAAAHAFDLRVVAEGIEDPDTLHALRTLGCDDAQGYLLARPMPADRLPAWLETWPTHRATILRAVTPSAQAPSPTAKD